jgi:hypothetical protein
MMVLLADIRGNSPRRQGVPPESASRCAAGFPAIHEH